MFPSITKNEINSLLGPWVVSTEHTDPTRFDSNAVNCHSWLLQDLVQSCFLYGSWGDFLLVGQRLKFPFWRCARIKTFKTQYKTYIFSLAYR